MPTMEDLILSIEVERDQAIKRRDRATAEVKTILATARQDGRANLTDEEDADVKSAFTKRDIAARDLIGIDSKLETARRTKQMEDDVEVGLHERSANPGVAKPAYDRVARIGSEERTYHRGNSGKGGLFLRDVVRSFLFRDIDAETRLSRHMQEERVERGQYLERAASTTGNFAGLTVPQYLTELYAPAVAALRPFADVCNHHDLPPDGMTVNISRITTPTGVALQATEGTSVDTGAVIDDTLLTENVLTAAGMATLSRQAIDRGTGVEDITMDDLQRRYASTLDSTLINQATTGLAAVGVSQTLTATTLLAAYGGMIGAASTIETTLLGFAQPDVVVMHPRRWYRFMSAIAANWPVTAGQNNGPGPQLDPQSTFMMTAAGYAKGIRGFLQNGLAVCVDANISTACLATALTGGTQDQMYVVPSAECHLWEDPNAPQFIRAEQPQAGSLAVQLVLYGYFAYSFRRFTNATVNINGAALVPPVFDGS
jgi:hypothetical protein